MGMKHLGLIEKLFNDNPDQSYSKTQIRDELGFNYTVVLDVLAYLLKEKKIKEINKAGDVTRYKGV